MGPFYAYAKTTTDNISWRYLITFASREIADEWWRMVSTPPSPCIGVFRRISPQYYTHTTQNLGDFFFRQKFPGNESYFEKMFFTLLQNRDERALSLFHPQDITDHVSGKWFYIRSKSDPRKYWYFCIDGECLVCGKSECNTVHVSTECRSRFCITAVDTGIPNDTSQPQAELIMIGGDQITISPSKDFTLHISDYEELKATEAQSCVPPDFLFSDLRTRFSARAQRLEGNGPICEDVVPVERGFGEAWELSG